MDIGSFYIKCPHCKELVEIESVNCAIFRHGVLKSNYQQIPPHAPKNICDELKKRKLIYGCSKPFKLIKKENDSEYIPIKCDYI